MPISEYFHGAGERVMKDMKNRYGQEKGERVFYATSNARKNDKPQLKPVDSSLKRSMRSAMRGRGKHKSK